MSIVKNLDTLVRSALAELDILAPESIVFEHPADLSHGDFSTNVAMSLAKQVQQNPKDLAEKIQFAISKNLSQEIEKITVAGPGFINFYLAKPFFQKAIPEILEKENDFGKTNILTDKKILVEHSSLNLFKPFTVGHMMNNAIGESLVRLMQFSGANVATMAFPSDISLGIAKAIFVLLEKYGSDFIADDVKILGNAYVEGTQRYTDDESIHIQVKEIADNLYAKKESPELEIFEKCKKLNIAYFESVLQKLGSHFDTYIYESEAGNVGKEIIQKNTPGIFTESQGAIVYIPEESKKHINTAVFINSQGNPTYEAKDIGLLQLKFERIHPDVSIFVTDHEQIPHFQIVLDAGEKIQKDWSEKSVHMTHGRMNFKGQKMSSRLGGVPLAEDMLQAVSEEVKERSTHNDSAEVYESIAIGAIKFSILRAKPGQNINFDPETSLSFEGDSGPYLQYTHARICSLIEKGAGLNIHPNYHTGEISDLEKMLYRFPEIVESAITGYAPQHVVTYLLEVARAFNSFYGANQIVDVSNKDVSQHRLAVARATQIILKNGLYLLGIKAPEKM
ncbi:MAG: arginine--tRNA ligase [Candidatus Pacebacteria bacterium]|nr:arginine--tRNA ligase [Candidatus Paceibacterota bacterium]